MWKDLFEGLWFFLSFEDYRYSHEWSGMAASLLVWALFVTVVAVIWKIGASVGYTIYRLTMYDYEELSLFATVTGKEYEPESVYTEYDAILGVPVLKTLDAEYCVEIVTENGLKSAIGDAELFDAVEPGSSLRVTMKIGRERKEGKIKYWRILEYATTAKK